MRWCGRVYAHHLTPDAPRVPKSAPMTSASPVSTSPVFTSPADTTLTITRPDDWHLHVRDGTALASVVPHSAAQFGRALIMPNLKPPVTTAALASAYRESILAAVPKGVRFQPLMSLYLTDKLAPEEIARAKAAG